MRGERPSGPVPVWCWVRRIGFRLHSRYDPVKEITRRLFPPRKARCVPVTSNRSLAWPFTPLAWFRLTPTKGLYGAYRCRSSYQ